MCGIAGGIGEIAYTRVQEMCDAIHRRGPDAQGIFREERVGLALGHKRLAIIDVSDAGAQPMTSRDGRFVLSYNGEIYNHLSLREWIRTKHAAYPFAGTSDTESLLESISIFGLEGTLRRAVGMFAFALYDRQEGLLHLERDRAGEKPLYYGWQGGEFFFASDLASILALRLPLEINRSALGLYCRYGYFPAPYTVFEKFYKLHSGRYLTIAVSTGQTVKESIYWDACEAASHAMDNRFDGTAAEALGHLQTLLDQAVAGQMMSDVPLGAFLSGGIDSSLIVATMQKLSKEKVKTFTIGFHEQASNEAEFSKAVAAHLGTDHTEWYITPKEALDVIPKLPEIYSEPFADSSQIPTYLVSKLARQAVTVSLSGDGGDELFGGYNRYSSYLDAWEKAKRIPARKLVGRMAMLLSDAPLIKRDIAQRVYRGGCLLTAQSDLDAYREVGGYWKQRAPVVKAMERDSTLAHAMTDGTGLPAYTDMRELMMLTDYRMYLPDDILVKVDRAAMAVSLETRVPLLDHRLVAFSYALPPSIKMRGEEQKWPLKQLLYRMVPQELLDRPKKGFSVPLREWLVLPMREWAEALLSEENLRHQGFFDAAQVRREWKDLLSGRIRDGANIWTILMFQAWLERYYV